MKLNELRKKSNALTKGLKNPKVKALGRGFIRVMNRAASKI